MKIVIAGVEYKVKFEKHKKSISDNEPLAQILYTKGLIQVYKKMSDCRIRRCLMHEIVHGVVTGYSIGQLHDSDGSHNECSIDQLAIGLCEALESLGLYLPTSEDKGNEAKDNSMR